MHVVGTRRLKSALEDKAARLGDRPFLIFEDAGGHPGGCWSWCDFDEHVELRESFPRTSVGKIQKHLLCGKDSR